MKFLELIEENAKSKSLVAVEHITHISQLNGNSYVFIRLTDGKEVSTKESLERFLERLERL